MEKTFEDIGIYTDIHESGNRSKDGYKLYYATCKICGTQVEKELYDIKRSNKVCRHKSSNKIYDSYRVNDMPNGWINNSYLNKRIYYTWKSMIELAKESYWKKFPTYEGTTIDESWRILSNIVRDIQTLEGYEMWANNPNKGIMLDKDTLVEGNKHYSKTTCRFITHAESNQDVAERHPENIQKAREALIDQISIPVRFVHKDGQSIDFPSLKEGCRVLGLNERNAWTVLSDKYPGRKTTKGWLIIKINK